MDSPDRFAAAARVADAVLYEGYVLYPYRASAPKNQLRWQFGVLVPQGYHRLDPSERYQSRTEVVLAPADGAVLRVRVRGLHLQRRTVQAAAAGGFVPVDALDVDGVCHVPWDEAVDAVVELAPLAVSDLEAATVTQPFHLDATTSEEHLYRRDGQLAGRFRRRREAVTGTVTVALTRSGTGADGYAKVAVTVTNTTVAVTVTNTTLPAPGLDGRDAVLARSYLAVHVMLAVEGGSFVSLLDPPPGAAEVAATCRSDGAYPVLVGTDDVVLSSPIILYDHPEVASESPGDLYDSTEIDEILALRIVTLTDAEKAEARGTDARAAAVIDRCEAMAPDVWAGLHGTFRTVERDGRDGADRRGGEPAAGEAARAGTDRRGGEPTGGETAPVEARPWWDPGADEAVDPATDHVVISGREVRRGTPVVLRPARRADAQDLFLAGRPATVAAVLRDVDDNHYVAVTLDDDPMAAELEWQGRYCYFYPDELELPADAGRRP